MKLLQYQPLSETMGAEVTNVNFGKPISSIIVGQLKELICEYQLLIFRKQDINLDEQIRACKQFGEVEPHPGKNIPWGRSEVTYVANVDLEGNLYETCGPTFELWHSDTCYLPIPARYSFLFAEKVPSTHGETLFANMQLAFQELSNNIKQLLIGRKAIFGSGLNLMRRCREKGYELEISEDEIMPDVLHPVIRTHPESKKPSIYVNWAHTDRIVDLSLEESNRLLKNIYQHCRQPDYVYTHYYEQGDLAMWDNAATIHSNCVGKLLEPRIMRRVMIKGESAPYHQYCAN